MRSVEETRELVLSLSKDGGAPRLANRIPAFAGMTK